MIKARCIQKFRDNQGKIIGYRLQDLQEKTIGYRLQDLQEKTIDIKPEELKNEIVSNQIEVTNLTLTADGRLVDRKQSETNRQQKRFPTDQELESIILKSKMIGLKVEDLGFNCNAIFKSTEDVMVIISSNLKRIVYEKDSYFSNKYKAITQNCKTLKVIGGSGLTSTRKMFYDCEAQIIDLSSFDTSNVKNMSEMFSYCNAQTLDLSSFNASRVKDMCCMFYFCKAQTLDLSSFNTSKVEDMNSMFCGCMAQTLDLSSFNTSRVKDMCGMFEYCKAQITATDPKILKKASEI